MKTLVVIKPALYMAEKVPGVNWLIGGFAGAVDFPFVTVEFLAEVYAAAGDVYFVAL